MTTALSGGERAQRTTPASEINASHRGGHEARLGLTRGSCGAMRSSSSPAHASGHVQWRVRQSSQCARHGAAGRWRHCDVSSTWVSGVGPRFKSCDNASAAEVGSRMTQVVPHQVHTTTPNEARRPTHPPPKPNESTNRTWNFVFLKLRRTLVLGLVASPQRRARAPRANRRRAVGRKKTRNGGSFALHVRCKFPRIGHEEPSRLRSQFWLLFVCFTTRGGCDVT